MVVSVERALKRTNQHPDQPLSFTNSLHTVGVAARSCVALESERRFFRDVLIDDYGGSPERIHIMPRKYSRSAGFNFTPDFPIPASGGRVASASADVLFSPPRLKIA